MKYENIVKGIFKDRPNRFIANVEIENLPEIAHVKNTGRCLEILRRNTDIYLQKSNNKDRKTKWSLISAYKGDQLINIDSQIPNYVFKEAVCDKLIKIPAIENIKCLQSEKKFGSSRFDFFYETDTKKGFIEIKGVTLEENKIAMFPDAPTVRGARHIMELIESKKNGYESMLVFIIQMKGIKVFKPNSKMDKLFTNNLIMAQKAGVGIMAIDCIVRRDSIVIDEFVKVELD